MTSSKPKKQSLSLLRGMRDVLPEEERYWIFMSDRVRDFALRFGFRRIETPILEQANLYMRTSGPSSDVVTKEMYEFSDPGNERVALRPEGTPGVARAYIEHGMLNQPQPVKVYYSGPMFRHDRPQAGRYRQHHQFGFEVIGEQSPVVDAMLIMMGFTFYAGLGLNIQVDVNSIGCGQCRPRYVKKLSVYLNEHKKKLSVDDQERLKKNPLRVLDTKDPAIEEVLVQAPQTVDNLCDECKEHFVLVLEYLDEMDVRYNLNARIVRGLDYYTKTTWELLESGKAGSQDALGGGGRY
ncbi:MAG: histidine--tRNA ligase, partial [Patescibacteria group bacterium]